MRTWALLAFIPFVLLGCGGEQHEDLREWMREQSKGMRGKVAPLPEITAFPVVAYEAELLTPPFAPGKIVTLDAIADKTAPDRNRRQQPLEAFPIEDLKLMGVILSGSIPYGLIQTPAPNKPKYVQVGEYMGRNFGKITAITSEGVTVLETVKDLNGAWVQQERKLIVPKGGQ